MRKTRKKSAGTKPQAAPVKAETQARRAKQAAARRTKSVRDWGIALVVLVVAGAGLFQYTSVANAREDLTRVGVGQPMVVQVHDRNCLPCGVLQGQTKKALKSFDKSDLGYVVADLNKQKGYQFAQRHQAGQTTLLLFDAEGKMQRRLVGEREPEALVDLITSILEVPTK